MPDRSFGRTVRYRRTKLGLSQARLGDLVGRSPSTIRSWERDKSAPNETVVLHALAAILGVDERSLFEKAGQDPPPESETSPTLEEALATLHPVEADAEPVDVEAPVTDVERDDDEEADEEADQDTTLVPVEDHPPEPAGDEEHIGNGPLPPEEAPVELAEPGRPGEEEGADDEPEYLPAARESRPVATLPRSPEPGYVAPPEPFAITAPTPPVVEPSYMEDDNQRQLYRVRNLATVVVVVAMVVALLWALAEGLDAIGTWWDDFFGSLRL